MVNISTGLGVEVWTESVGECETPDYYEGDDYNDVVNSSLPRCCGPILHTRAEALQGS